MTSKLPAENAGSTASSTAKVISSCESRTAEAFSIAAERSIAVTLVTAIAGDPGHEPGSRAHVEHPRRAVRQYGVKRAHPAGVVGRGRQGYVVWGVVGRRDLVPEPRDLTLDCLLIQPGRFLSDRGFGGGCLAR